VIESPPSQEQKELQSRTAAHYDAYPFDFLRPVDEDAIEEWQTPPLRRFIGRHAVDGARIAEIGCGPGRTTLYLLRRGFMVLALDISRRSLELARRRAPGALFVCATNLSLPLPDNGFDMVISDGVIHHTPCPRQAFAENVRILRFGGVFFVGVYNRHGHYYYIYTFIGPIIRRFEKSKLGRCLIFTTILPIYWIVHLIKSSGRRTWRGAVNFFYDYIITPSASFHSYEEICDWGKEDGLQLIEYDSGRGNVHVFTFRKKPVG
jgi:SAM-dependent methyltransferase